MANKYYFSYRTNNVLILGRTFAVDYNTAREQCSWYWRNVRADSFSIYDEEFNPVMMRIRGHGTTSKHIPYTNR
jgi:hypothetical protein